MRIVQLLFWILNIYQEWLLGVSRIKMTDWYALDMSTP